MWHVTSDMIFFAALDPFPVTCHLPPVTFRLQCNRNRRVWDAKEIIDGAVNGIHHPAIFGTDIAGTTFLAEQWNFWKRGAEDSRDEFLAAHIEFELDVVGVGGIDALGQVPVGQHELSGGARGFNGGFLCCQ